jgi:hypothetical protein
MKSMRIVTAVIVLAAVTGTAFAVDPVHHPEPVKGKVVDKPATKASAEQLDRMDDQMHAMRDMHEKMMNAKTPDERQALMAEHMKTMQNGMSMMSGMTSHTKQHGKHAMPPEAMQAHIEVMQKQMDMMQTMIQLMMDRMTTPPPGR